MKLPTPSPARISAAVIASGLVLTGLTQFRNTRMTSPENRPLQVTDAGYVTSADCRSCHPGQYASWHASFHRTMTQLATPGNVIPQMDGLELSLDRVIYRVERTGEAFFVHTRPLDARAAGGAPARPREIVLLTGSHNQQNLWMETGEGRALEPFPFGWLVAEQRWAPTGDTFLSPPEETHVQRGHGVWNNTCVTCHTTNGRPRFASETNFDSRVSEFGIACEACHGEGGGHVRRHRDPIGRYLAHLGGGADRTIANPGRMSGPDSALVCGQCHSIWAFENADALVAWNRAGAKFRPGQADLAGRFVVQPATSDHAEQKKAIRDASPHFFDDSFWGDGMVRVTGREYNGVAASPCFKGGAFSCLSCHEMHPAKTDRASIATWTVNQMKPDATSDRACLQCHPSIGARLAEHTHHAAGSVGSRCYECHMPRANFGLLRAVRSHRISSPTVDESVALGRPNACNLCHLDKPLAWTADKLTAWYGRPAPPAVLSRDDREIAAGAKWLLSGDAGQRALVAWSMGWEPAQKAAGRAWLAPYLAVTLNDSYSAVRFVAGRSLRTLPGFEEFSFDYTAADAETFAAGARAYQHALDLQRGAKEAFAPAVLLDPLGRFQPDTYQRLLDERDQRRIFLVE